MKLCPSPIALALTLASASVAHAGPGDAAVTPPPVPPGQSGVVIVQEGTYAPPAGQPPAPGYPPGAVQTQGPVYGPGGPPPLAEPYSNPRMRWGLVFMGGRTNVGGNRYDGGGTGGVAFRVGFQIDRMWSVTYTGTALFGGYIWINPFNGESKQIVFATVYNTISGNVTVVDRLDFGLGLSADRLAALSVETSTAGGSTTAVAGTGVGLDLRATVSLGPRNLNETHRRGFAFTLNFHPTFALNTVISTATLGIGAEWF